MFKQIKRGLILCCYLYFAHTLQGQTTYFSRQFDTLSMVETSYNAFNETFGYSTVFSGYSASSNPQSTICYRKLDFEGNDLPGQFCLYLDSLSFAQYYSQKNPDGNLMVCGPIREINSLNTTSGIGIFRFDINGNTSLSKRIFTDSSDYTPSYLFAKDSYFLISGQVEKNGDGDMFLMKLDLNGNILFKKTYGGAYYDGCYSAIQTPDNGFLLLGWTRSFGNGQRDYYLVKTDSLGNQEWQKTYGTSANEGGWGITALHDGNYLLGGGGANPGINGWAQIKKINPLGTIIWQNNYVFPGALSCSLNWPKELPNGDIVAVGLTTVEGESNGGYLLKTDSMGNEIWQQKYNFSPYPDLFKNVTLTPDGGFLLSGFCINSATSSSDGWLLKVDSLGCPYPNCTVGIEEESKKVAFNLWPNPAVNELHIELHGSARTNLVLHDAIGRVVLQKVLYEKECTFDLSTISAGIYTAEIDIGKEKYFKKLIIAKE